ncbi:GNAT family N-acetyltransferase [Leifsonia sp. NPDC102414]|uniref:GNAT family N-acetyltransferase n=1 Tax=Leifsonia sp. NPDC102414 TaxID=3364124 RepID=UPI00381942D5
MNDEQSPASDAHVTGRVPAGLTTTEFVLRPIVAGDAANDHAALMETRDELRLWEQSSWPEDDFTVEANRDDLAGLEARHNDRRALTYTVLDPAGRECLGCVYVFPTGASFLTKATVTPVGDDAWVEVDLVVYFWVRRSRMATAMDDRLLAALRAWFADEWDAEKVIFVVSELFAQQVELIRRTDLALRFELVEPQKPGRFLVFG